MEVVGVVAGLVTILGGLWKAHSQLRHWRETPAEELPRSIRRARDVFARLRRPLRGLDPPSEPPALPPSDAGRRRRVTALLFADIVDSTRHMREDDAAALDVRAELIRLSKEAVRARRGRWVKSVGDGILATFGAGEAAVAAALQLQRRFGSSEVAARRPSALRVSVHMGDVLHEPGGNVIGDAVNVLFRIDRAGSPGQVWISRATRDSIRSRSTLFRTRSEGHFELEGAGEEELFVVWGAEDAEPPVAEGEPLVVREEPPETPREAWPAPPPQSVPAGPSREASADVTRLYLEEIEKENRFVEVRSFDPGTRVSPKLELDRVFTLLVAGGTVGRGSAVPGGPSAEGRFEQGARGIHEVVSEHPHVVLVGDPGSGKTTFLRFVAQRLARAHLRGASLDPIGLGAEPDPALPVLVGLEDLGAFLRSDPDPSLGDADPEHLNRFLSSPRAPAAHLRLPPNYLRDRLSSGGCFLLLDGLDEVHGHEMRQRLIDMLEKVIRAGDRVGNRHLMTCRTRAYGGEAQLVADVATYRLADFEPEQVREFAGRWSRALYGVDSGDSQPEAVLRADTFADSLAGAIAANPLARELSRTPLTLTMLALLHEPPAPLPEQRAELFEKVVEYLLKARASHTDRAVSEREAAIRRLAIHMFTKGPGVHTSLGRRDAAAVVAPVLEVDEAAAIRFLEGEEQHSGLVVSRSTGEVEFWHGLFREYLAAWELALDHGPAGVAGTERDPGWQTVVGHLHDDQWAEVVLFYAACVHRENGAPGLRRIIDGVLSTGEERTSLARAVGLVGRILDDLRVPEESVAHTGYARALGETVAIFERDGDAVAESVRVEVGEALGAAGDPRLTGKRIPVPGDTFLMGAQSSAEGEQGYDPDALEWEAPVREVTVGGFDLGEFPVTVQEYRRFVEAGGYAKEALWDTAGWRWRVSEEARAPDEWDSQLRHRNRPVTGVSWFEADAYCRSVGGRLPSEAEWELAARGPESRRYPWGGADEPPTDRHASFNLRLREPSPVGIYPLGATPSGIQDLAGNVWEWCSDAWDRSDPVSTDGEDRGSRPSRVVRGGAFDCHPSNLRASFRDLGLPVNRFDSLGFRVVWESSGGQG